jgi:NAD(P)-dependent dehydrogenase (short-subunit alcohol dehydrogenase family)
LRKRTSWSPAQPPAKVRREREATPMNRFVAPQEVASVMLFICSADASAMTGQANNVTGGFIKT